MKKIFLLSATILMGCSLHCKKVIKIEETPSKECIYTVNDPVNYTFIDSCGKYSIGEHIK